MIDQQILEAKLLIGGEWMDGPSSFDVHDPEDGRVIARVPSATAEMVDLAVDKAREAAVIAREMPVHQRQAVLRRAALLMEERAETIARRLSQDCSKTIREARGEVRRATDTLHLSAEEARRVHGETLSFGQRPGAERRLGYYYRFPLGIVAAITPFNDPLNLVVHKVGPAIATGNAVVLKPASAAPLGAITLVELMLEAGLPPQVLTLLTGSGRVIGDRLVGHPGVQMVSFTGGLATGMEISRRAGIKKLAMELGASSPVLVLGDADLDLAADAVASGAFGNAGQNCLGVQRVLLERPIAEAFTERLLSRTAALRMGSKASEESDMGPMIAEREAQRVARWVEEAASGGAELLCGGRRHGAFFEPTVLRDVPDGCLLDREEVYGPVVSLYVVDDVEAAIDKANDSAFGLQAGVFTQDVDLAFHCIQRLHVGGVMVNDSSDFRIDAMPFGGVKGSGLGREGVHFAAEAMTETKVVCFNVRG